jgi:hypothetical protein
MFPVFPFLGVTSAIHVSCSYWACSVCSCFVLSRCLFARTPIGMTLSASIFPFFWGEFLTQCAMVKERRRRSQQERARDAERKRVARRVDSTATGPDAVERRVLVREQNRDRQRARRDRLAVERAARSRLSPASQFFLPLHQYQALHAFMDRLLLARADVHDCDVCLERYYGMKMHAERCCDRCHREVSFIFIRVTVA